MGAFGTQLCEFRKIFKEPKNHKIRGPLYNSSMWFFSRAAKCIETCRLYTLSFQSLRPELSTLHNRKIWLWSFKCWVKNWLALEVKILKPWPFFFIFFFIFFLYSESILLGLIYIEIIKVRCL